VKPKGVEKAPPQSSRHSEAQSAERIHAMRASHNRRHFSAIKPIDACRQPRKQPRTFVKPQTKQESSNPFIPKIKKKRKIGVFPSPTSYNKNRAGKRKARQKLTGLSY